MLSKYFHYLKLKFVHREGKCLLLDLTKWSNVTIQNLTLNEYSGNLIKSTQPKSISISSSVFKNLDLVEVTPFIKVVGPIYSRSYAPLIKDSVFQNITTTTSLILLQTELRSLIENTTFTDISKKNLAKELETIEYAQVKSEWPGGICLLLKMISY